MNNKELDCHCHGDCCANEKVEPCKHKDCQNCFELNNQIKKEN